MSQDKAVPKGPVSGVKAAKADLEQVNELDRPFQRYIFFPNQTLDELRGNSFAWNAISRSGVIELPEALGIIARVDLRLFYPGDQVDIFRIWEEFKFDPMFSTLITFDTLDLVRKEQLLAVRRFVHDGRRMDPRELGELKLKAGDILRLDAKYLPLNDWYYLRDQCRTEAPIVDYRYFLTRALTEIKNQHGSATIFGGRYYALSGVNKRVSKKGTDEDNLFARFGLADPENGLSAKQAFAKFKPDQRLAMFISDVTAGPRSVVVAHGLQQRGGQSIVTFTRDVKKGNIDSSKHSVLSVFDIEDDAREIIFAQANGFNGWVLVNGDGAFQEVVPPDIASDRTIPSPYPPELQPGMGCISCHGADGSDGFKPLRNDVLTLFRAGGFLGDPVNQKDKDYFATLARFKELYAGNPTKVLNNARDDYSDAVGRATGYQKPDAIKVVSSAVVKSYYDYVYKPIGAREALNELGLTVHDDEAKNLEELRKMFKLTAGQIEDPRILGLQAGLKISRMDWSLSYSFAAGRAQQYELFRKVPKGEKGLGKE
jgi:hypothetical protein